LCGITSTDVRKTEDNQQHDAQSELDDPEFRQEFVQKLKTLFDGNFEEESMQQLQDILDNIRSNQTIAMDASDKYTQVYFSVYNCNRTNIGI
jgi:Zn-dependent M16 (insulinase) family peptidase